MIVEEFAQTLKTKIAIKNFDRRSEPEMKKQLYKLIEEELAKIVTEHSFVNGLNEVFLTDCGDFSVADDDLQEILIKIERGSKV